VLEPVCVRRSMRSRTAQLRGSLRQLHQKRLAVGPVNFE
jgi:hypothetical protein